MISLPMTPSHDVEDADLNESDLNESDLSARTDTQGLALSGKECCVAVRRVMLAAKKDRSLWYLGDEGESCDSSCLNAGAKYFARNAASAFSSMSPKLLFDAAREAGVACTASEAVTWLPLILPAIIQSRFYNTSGESGGPQNENVQATCFYALQTSTEGGRGRDADRESNKDVDVCGAWEEGGRRLCLCQVEPSYTHQEAQLLSAKAAKMRSWLSMLPSLRSTPSKTHLQARLAVPLTPPPPPLSLALSHVSLTAARAALSLARSPPRPRFFFYRFVSYNISKTRTQE